MNVFQLQRMRAAVLEGTDKARTLPRPGESGASKELGFGEALTNAISEVDGAQKEADAQVSAFVAGEQENLHEVMISMNQAELYLQLMTEVRNRMLETYQELMRMQV
ncbi:MAG: flagellar hook-basal body complex protein FliE [Rhodothermales bacterium]